MSGDFWSRRRAAVAAEMEALEARQRAAERARAEAELETKSDEEILAELELPMPEDLTSPEDVRSFLTRAVPQRLKARALRRLWRLNPVLANVDGLVDYGEDFTDSANVIENMQTAYQVGKGMLGHIQALAEAETGDEAGTMALAETTDDAARTDALDDAEGGETVALAESAGSGKDDESAEQGVAIEPARRRMTFHFEAGA